MNKRDQTLEKKIINSNNLFLHNQKSQTRLDPSLSTFFAVDLTLSDPSIFNLIEASHNHPFPQKLNDPTNPTGYIDILF